MRKYDAAARAEHEAVRKGVGYYDFTHKLLKVTGSDAQIFLDRVFVGAIGKTKTGEGKYTTMLNENGMIIDDVIIFRVEEETFWISTLYIDELISWFESHQRGENLEYEEITDGTVMYAVQGPSSRDVLNEFLDDSVDDLKYFDIMDTMAEGAAVKIARSGYTGELGYEIYCHPEDAAFIENKLEIYGEPYHIMKITSDVIITSLPGEKGLVLMSDLEGTNPLEAGFDWTIDWETEFIGKGALDNARKEGGKRALLGFTLMDDMKEVEPGSEVIVNDEVAGKVTMSTYGYTVEKRIGFALVDTDKVKIGDHAVIGTQNAEAVITARTFI